MVQIQKLTVTDANLILDYRVSNPFEDAIWVCYDLSARPKDDVQGVATRIDGEAVRIQLRCNIERVGGFVDPPPIAKYVRLPPGESYSGRIRRDLPIRDYVREWQAGRKEHKEIVLHRVLFEVGYFGPDCNEYFASVFEWSKKEPDKYKPVVVEPFYVMSGAPFITEEPLDGKSREVLYTEKYLSFIGKERSAEVLITDVNIPCSVVVDDK
jgi:hypothetical protein